MVAITVLQVLLLTSGVVAQRVEQTVYGQCGGSQFAGPTACRSGNYCSYKNPWYSQCLPGSADAPLADDPDQGDQGGGGDAPIGITPIGGSAPTGQIPDSPIETGGGGGGNGGGGPVTTIVTTVFSYLTPSPTPSSPQLTVIGGTTYTIIRDPQYTGNKAKREQGEGGRTGAVATATATATTLARVRAEGGLQRRRSELEEEQAC